MGKRRPFTLAQAVLVQGANPQAAPPTLIEEEGQRAKRRLGRASGNDSPRPRVTCRMR